MEADVRRASHRSAHSFFRVTSVCRHQTHTTVTAHYGYCLRKLHCLVTVPFAAVIVIKEWCPLDCAYHYGSPKPELRIKFFSLSSAERRVCHSRAHVMRYAAGGGFDCLSEWSRSEFRLRLEKLAGLAEINQRKISARSASFACVSRAIDNLVASGQSPSGTYQL